MTPHSRYTRGDGIVSPLRNPILRLLRQRHAPMSTHALAEQLDVSEGRVLSVLQTLTAMGLVYREAESHLWKRTT